MVLATVQKETEKSTVLLMALGTRGIPSASYMTGNHYGQTGRLI
jgi:hypothetical protein